MSTPNWAKLKAEGRVKDIGIPWTDEEKKAFYEFKIPADFIRRGALTLKDYEKIQAEDAKALKKTGELPLVGQELKDLQKKAKKLGVEFTPDAGKEALIREITRAEEALKAEEEAKAKAKADAEAVKAKAKADKEAAKKAKAEAKASKGKK